MTLNSSPKEPISWPAHGFYPDDPTNTPRLPPITLDCELDDFSTESTYEVAQDKDGNPDFTAVWAAKLYELCAQIDPEGVYVEDGYAASESQIAEIKAALKLCPKHPHAAKWRAAVKRGEADVEDRYWERQNKSGEIIDNNDPSNTHPHTATRSVPCIPPCHLQARPMLTAARWTAAQQRPSPGNRRSPYLIRRKGDRTLC